MLLRHENKDDYYLERPWQLQVSVPGTAVALCCLQDPGHDGKCLPVMAQIGTKHEDLYEKVLLYLVVMRLSRTALKSFYNKP